MAFRAKPCTLRCIVRICAPDKLSTYSLATAHPRFLSPFSTQPILRSSNFPPRLTTPPSALSTKSTPSLTSIPTDQSSTVSSHLNPPSTALPPPLDLPARTPSQSAFSYFYNLGKAYLRFYKNGLKAIYSNYKLSRSIRARLPPISLSEALKRDLLSRGEYQLLQRTRKDVRLLPLFALVYLICGEFTPLVVVALSGLVPRTLWIPKQVESARKKQEARRKALQETWYSLSIPAKYDNTTVLSPVQTTEILKLGHMLGLYPTWWERLPLAPTGIMRRRVDRALQEIDMDDFAIARDGGPEGLEAEEVRMAAETRGMDILGRDEGTVRGDLEWWIRKREGLSVVDLLREKVEGNEKRT